MPLIQSTTNSSITPLISRILEPSVWIALFIYVIVFLILVFVIRKFFYQFTGLVKEASIEKRSLGAVIFEVRLPKNNETEIQAADQMFSGLLSISKKLKGFGKHVQSRSFVSFEIVALPETIRFYVVSSKNIANTVEKAINSAYPSAEIVESKEYNIFPEGSSVEFASLRLDKDSYKPIRTYEELSTDSLAALLTTMSKLSMGESLAYQIIITSAGDSWRNQGKAFVSKVREHNSNPEKKSKMKVPEDLLSAIEKKCEKGGFFVDIKLVSVSTNREAAKMYLDSVISSFSQFNKEGSNKFKTVSLSKGQRKSFMKDFIYRTSRETSILNTAELATILHYPNKNMDVPYIHWLLSKRAPATSGIPSSGDLWLGVNIHRNVEKHIYMMRDDRRRHKYIIGKTGSGKSYALQSMALQDITKGEGIAFLDPHGDSAEWLLERIPPHRIEDVIYWNPGDFERPIGFNILEHFSEQDKHRVVNSFLALMKKMYDPHNQGITGPRFERAVRNGMLTVMEDPGATLIEVLRVLSDEKYAQKLIPNIKDELVKRYWTDEIARTQDFHKSEILGYIVSKFDRFVTNKLTRNIFGQSKSGFNMREVMDKQKILIVNLSKGIMGEENSQFLGLLLVPRILSAAMSRADMHIDKRKDFYLYVDEFQNFSTEDFAQILSEARKYKLNLIVANQYIAQIDEKIRDAVFGNVGTVISFKVGTTDAQFLETIFRPTFDADDLTNIENTNAYVKLIHKGESPPGFSLSTHYDLAPFKIPRVGNAKIFEIVKSLSRYKFGRDKALVESEIRKRASLDEKSEPTPKRAGGALGAMGGMGAGGGMGSPLKPKGGGM